MGSPSKRPLPVLCWSCGEPIPPEMEGVYVCGNCMFLRERKRRSQPKLKAPQYGNKRNNPRKYDEPWS